MREERRGKIRRGVKRGCANSFFCNFFGGGDSSSIGYRVREERREKRRGGVKRGCANSFYREVMRIIFCAIFLEGMTVSGSGSEDEGERERVGGRRERERGREERRVRRQSFSMECNDA